ncbi:hypothetical protein [Streptomyces scopuliridis]|uniref:hypothetical protein n=1 Tax=Streptomyces scopuliridis TaxID=452529 RepID=UPI0036C6AE9B
MARELSHVLGGTWREEQSPLADQLEVLTESSRLWILVEAVTDSLAFRLAEHADLGRFLLSFPTWTITEVMGGIADRVSAIKGKAVGELIVEPLDFVARNALHVRYARPVLTSLGPWH